MKYRKGTFVVVPNKDFLNGKPSEFQSIYMWLCTYADRNGECFPARKTLAKNAGCSLNTLDKYIKQLIDDGLITKEVRKKENSKQNLSNTYCLMLLSDEDLSVVCDENRYIPEINEVQELHPDVIKNATTGGIKTEAVTISNTNSIYLTINSVVTLPIDRGDTPEARVNSIYGTLFNNKYGFYPTISNLKSRLKTIQGLLNEFSEIQLAFLLIVFFAWEKEKVYFESKSHALFLFKFNIDKFVSYVLNESGYDVEWKDDSQLLQVVGKNILSLTNK